MTNKHTPGPWLYKATTFGHPDRINPIIQVDRKSPAMTRGTGISYIGRVGWQGSTIPGMTSLTTESFEEAEANARLIAAAPDLLAALDFCENTLTLIGDADCCDVGPSGLRCNDCLGCLKALCAEFARAALAKAREEAS